MKMRPERIRGLLCAMLCCALGVIAGDFSCGTSSADGGVFWRGQLLLEPFFGRDGVNMLSDAGQTRSEARVSDGRKALNFISRKAPAWRVEKVLNADGAELEMTFGVGLPAFSENSGQRMLELRIPWRLVEGKPYQLVNGIRWGLKTRKGVFKADFAPINQVRFLALGEEGIPGPVLDLNPRGITSYDSDAYRNATLRGHWTMRRDGEYLVLSSYVALSQLGGYYGAKFRFFTGVIGDYEKRHARRRFKYLGPLTSSHRLSFGSSRHGEMFTSADALPYSDERGYGWLDGVAPSLVCEAPEGAYYSHAGGRGSAAFLFGKCLPGHYMLTIGCGNLHDGRKHFGISINGEAKVTDFELGEGEACDLTIPFYTKDGRIRVEFSGDWLVSVMNLQMLLTEYEDYVMRRGIWVVDDFEPMLGMSPNSAVRKPPEFPVGRECYPLPVPGSEAAGELKPFVRESVNVTPAPWQFELNLGSHGENLTAMSALLPPDAAEKMVRIHAENGVNFLIHNGIFSRHLYPSEANMSETQVLKRIADEAHKHGMHVLDHQDYSLVWDCGSGFRTLVEETPNLQHSLHDHGVHVSICPSAENRRRQFFERTLKLIRETGIDALMVDEVNHFVEADCCGCGDCRREFFKETGWHLPVNELSSDLNNPKSRLWQVWKEWQAKKIGDFWLELRRMIQEIRPDFAFMSYCTHRYFVEGWVSMERFRSGGIFGTEILNRNVFNSGRSTFSYRKLKNIITTCYGMPVMGLVYGSDEPGIGYFGWAMNNMNGQATWRMGARSFTPPPENMNRATARPIADIAVLFGRNSSSGNRSPNIASYTWLPGKVMGLAQTLDAMHQPYVFIDESFLTPERLSAYKVLMLPAASVLKEQEIQAIRDFAEKGGRLLITSITGTEDEYRQSRPWPFEEWFGLSPAKLGMGRNLRYKGAACQTTRNLYLYHVNGKPKSGVRTLVSYVGAPIPAVVEKRVGKGLVYWFNAELTRGLYMEEWFQPGEKFGFSLDAALNTMVQDLLANLIGDAASVRLKAPEEVFTSFYKDGDSAWVHFLNHTGFKCKPGEILPRTVAPDAFPALTEAIEGEIKIGRTISEVYAVSPDFKGRRALAYSQENGVVRFTLPPELLKVYTMVRLH